MSRRLWILVLPVMLFVTLLVGCTGTTATSIATPSASPTPQVPVPTSLQIYRVSGPPGTNVAPFEARTDQGKKIQNLFASMRALPKFIPSFTCPNDRGGGYILTFLDESGVVAQGFIPAGGCSMLVLSKPYGCHTLPEEIMRQLAETLNVQQSALGLEGEFYNTALPGSPTAPATLPSPLLPLSSCR